MSHCPIVPRIGHDARLPPSAVPGQPARRDELRRRSSSTSLGGLRNQSGSQRPSVVSQRTSCPRNACQNDAPTVSQYAGDGSWQGCRPPERQREYCAVQALYGARRSRSAAEGFERDPTRPARREVDNVFPGRSGFERRAFLPERGRRRVGAITLARFCASLRPVTSTARSRVSQYGILWAGRSHKGAACQTHSLTRGWPSRSVLPVAQSRICVGRPGGASGRSRATTS
jgi:hypothetical protein